MGSGVVRGGDVVEVGVVEGVLVVEVGVVEGGGVVQHSDLLRIDCVLSRITERCAAETTVLFHRYK